LNILFVPRWYPSRVDPMPGLFVLRQAEALAKSHVVQVLSVHPDPSCRVKFEVVQTVEKDVRTCRVYYKTHQEGNRLITKVLDISRFVKAHFKGVKALKGFRPDIIHGHVLTREILFAFYLAHKWHIPYLISEHWSRYLPENGTYKGMTRKWLTQFLVRRSAGVTAVSGTLKQAMLAHKLGHKRFYIVPNTIDTSAYLPLGNWDVSNKASILHVSCFEDKSKNIRGFLDSVALVFSSRTDFIVRLLGEGPDLASMKEYAASLGLGPDKVRFTGLIRGDDLIKLYQTSSFLVQSSRYETFGTVVAEALSCGLPVISTPTGIAPEIIDRSNGILLQQHGVNEMADAINIMLDNYTTFDRQKLHESISGVYAERKVTDQLTGIYRETISLCQKA